MARYDLPASIDYVLKLTNHTRLLYVGHSMGTTTYFAMLSDLPQYNKKILDTALFAPVAYVNHVKSPIRLLAPFSTEISVSNSYSSVGAVSSKCPPSFCNRTG